MNSAATRGSRMHKVPLLPFLLCALGTKLPSQAVRTQVIADAVRDQFSGGLIGASSQPLAGHLLPLGPYLFVDSTGNVGLGTTSPTRNLHVSNSSQSVARITTTGPYGTLAGLQIDRAGNGWTIGTGTNDLGGPGGLAFRTIPGLTVLSMTPAGSVGIGTTTPFEELTLSSSAPDLGIAITNTGLGGHSYVLYSHSRGSGNAEGSFVIQDKSVDTARLLIDSDGNVGINVGGRRPRAKLEVSGHARVTGGDLTVDGEMTVRTVVITGGADLAESFASTDQGLEPGTVMVLDPDQPGNLRVGTEPYDSLVAGVVPGAGGLRPGIVLSQQNRLVSAEMTGTKVDLALNGQVYAKCTAANGPIEPGDLLTTSAKRGRAMKVTEHELGRGAILGKAMSPLSSGEGLVRVLVSLQ